MTEQYANAASSTIANIGGINATALSVTLAAGEGAKFPLTGEFRAIIENEIILVRSRSTDTLSWTTTADRGIEGTTPASHGQNVAVKLLLTAASIRLIPEYARSAVGGGHGLADHSGSIFPTANQQLRGDLDGDTSDLRSIGLGTRFLTISAKTLRTEYVAGATPTGGTSGDLKVGLGLVWFRDSSGWHSISLGGGGGGLGLAGSADYRLGWNGDTGVLRLINLRTGIVITDSLTLGSVAAVAQNILNTLSRMGPSGTGTLGTPGGHIEWLNEGTDNTPIPIDDVIGRPDKSGTCDMTSGNFTFTVDSISGGVLSNAADDNRWIAIRGAKGGSKDLFTRLTNVTGGSPAGGAGATVTVNDQCGTTVVAATWSFLYWAGVRMSGAGLGNSNQGNGKPDAGSVQLVAIAGNFAPGDAKAIFDYRNNGFGAANLVMDFISVDAHSIADYGIVGWGTGTGNAVHFISCKAVGGRFASKGIGSWQDSETFGIATASGDEYWAACQWGNPAGGSLYGIGNGQVTNNSTDFSATGNPFSADTVGRIVVIYNGKSSNRVHVTRCTAYNSGNGHITLASQMTGTTNSTRDWFVVGGCGLFIGVSDVLLASFNVPTGTSYGIVVACGGIVTISLPCHVGGSTVGPDLLCFNISQADWTAYWDNIGPGTYNSHVGGGSIITSEVKTGGIHILPSAGSMIGRINISGRFNHNDAVTPTVYCDGGGGVSIIGPIRISKAFSNGFTGNVPAVIRYARSWAAGQGTFIGPEVDFTRVAKPYDNDGTSTAQPEWITEDCVFGTGNSATPGLNAQALNITVNPGNATPGVGSAGHLMRGTPDHVVLGVKGTAAAAGRFSWEAVGTWVVIHDSDTAEQDKVVSVVARRLAG